MTIEFHTIYSKVPEKLINTIRDELMNLVHLSKNISRAEVSLKSDEHTFQNENKICQIKLTIYGEDIVAHARTENFEKSANEVIKDLKRLVKQQLKKQKEPPDQMISTIKV